ncbi:hypothetical protein ABIA35_001169 [Catenulispora sp. MAP12-49]|jgi:hypothetical protein|uniref:YwqG family protein n=1 Tax=Catenulispora sp. MAP12-49 TaxID=3156302 RepID=UPI0035194671
MEISESPLAEAGRRFFSPENAKTWIELLRPGFHLREQNEGEPLVGYLGGEPLLPAGVEWPQWEGHGPLSFVAAVDCDEFPVAELDIPVPDSGMLFFFYFNGVGEDAVQYLDPDSIKGGTRVIYVPEGTPDVAPRSAPEGLEAFPRVMLTGELIATAPDNENSALVSAFGEGEDPAADDDYTEYPTVGDADGDGFYDALTSFRRDHSPHHRVGGYALPKAGSVTKEVAHVLAPGDDDAAKAARKALLPELVMLLQVDSDGRAGMEWGDTGRLYWLIRREDLAARDFDKATFTWQSE